MAGQIPDDSFAGSLSDPGIDPFEIPEAPPEQTTRAGQARASAMPVPGPISPDKKLPPENLYARMRAGAINALGLNNPILNTPQPNPAYSPTVAKTAGAISQGLGAVDKAIPPEARMIGSMFPSSLAEAPLWGGAKIAKGVTEYQPWRDEMIKDADPSIDQHLPWIWEESKKVFDKHLAGAPVDELGERHLPNLQNVVDQYNKGVEGQDWYLKTRPELEKQFGPDTDLFVNMLAATSPNATVPANMALALKAYKAYKNGLTDFRQFSDNPAHPGFLKPVIDNLNHVIRNEPITGMKINSFARNLRGETEPVTVDRWMMRALGMPNAHPDLPTTYKFADYWLSQVAHDIGVEPRQLQAAVWKTAREVGGQSASSGQPFEGVLAQKLAKDPDLNALLNRVRQSGAPQTAVPQWGSGPIYAPQMVPTPQPYARGGHVIDGGWYGQNAPTGSLRMADGGWNDPALWQPQPNPAYGTPGPGGMTNAQKILGPWLGGHLNAIAQGAIDPVIASLQLANRAIPGANQNAVDERLRNYREQYKQSLPGGQEDWVHQGERFLSSGATAGEMLPEIKVPGVGKNLPGILGKIAPGFTAKVASGIPTGAMYGALVPKETPHTLQETRGQVVGGMAGGVGEEFLAPPIERGIAALITNLGASPQTAAKIAEQATWRASDALPDPSVPGMRVPSAIEHEAEAQAATAAAHEANPVAHAIARRFTHAAGDTVDPANFTNTMLQPQAWQPPSPPTPRTPEQQGYDALQDPLLSSGEPYAGGGLYGQMRRATLSALRKGAR